MLRIVHSLGLLLIARGVRVDMRSHSPEAGTPTKKAFGPERRSCRRRPKDAANHSEAVIGGTVVDDPGEFPFIAWLGDNDGSRYAQFCGGSLISERIVLTAGHCLYDDGRKNARLWVRLRLVDFEKAIGVARSVVNWRRHPRYSKATLHNDLTLLLLNESVPSSLVEPLRLSDGTKSYEQSGQKTIVGWGSTDEDCHNYDTLLRKSQVPFGEVFATECSTVGSKTVRVRDDFDATSQCCAGDYAGDMHYPGCGDSGGPLLAKDGDNWTQVGMVSWSFGVPYPDVFTRVSYFRDWIEKTSAALLREGVHPIVKSLAEQ